MSYLDTLLSPHPRGRHRAVRRAGSAPGPRDAVARTLYLRFVRVTYPLVVRAFGPETPGGRLLHILVPAGLYDRLAHSTLPRRLHRRLASATLPDVLYDLLVRAPGLAALGGFIPYVLLSAFVPALMNAPVAGGLDVGAVLGLLQLAGFLCYAAWAPHSAPLDAPALEEDGGEAGEARR